MFAGLQGWQLVIIIALVLLLFAAPKLPAMARNLGQSMRIFKSEVKQMKDDGAKTEGGREDASEPVEGRVVDDAPDAPHTRGRGRTSGTTDQP